MSRSTFADQCERLIQVDSGGRGLLAPPVPPKLTGPLARAARSLAKMPQGTTLGVVTGFPILAADPVMHETDGPLGAWFLARVAATLGHRVWVASERKYGEGLWELVGDAGGDIADAVELHDLTPDLKKPKCDALVAIERPGPSPDGRCRSMGGLDLSEHAVDVSGWFAGSGCITIGIGDGGNEIGMASAFTPESLAARVPNGAKIACRIACGELIACGVSNWGGYALGLCWARARRRKLPRRWLLPENERRNLQILLDCGMVDGMTGKPEGRIDGLTWDEYAAPFAETARLFE